MWCKSTTCTTSGSATVLRVMYQHIWSDKISITPSIASSSTGSNLIKRVCQCRSSFSCSVCLQLLWRLPLCSLGLPLPVWLSSLRSAPLSLSYCYLRHSLSHIVLAKPSQSMFLDLIYKPSISRMHLLFTFLIVSFCYTLGLHRNIFFYATSIFSCVMVKATVSSLQSITSLSLRLCSFS